jgi:phage gpG-like protein
MTDISIDLSGVPRIREALEDLKDDYESNAVYAVGTNTEYATYLEFGTRKMPPYPFFMPAVREFQANPEAFITDNTGFSGIDEIGDTDTFIRAVATALKTQIEKNANAAGATDRSPGTDPEHPKVDTGNLRASIDVVRVR